MDGYQFYPASAGKFCEKSYYKLNSCDGSYKDCVDKGKEICNNDTNCYGVQYHPGWSNSPNRKSAQFCTTKNLVYKDAKDWYVHSKCATGKVLYSEYYIQNIQISYFQLKQS